MIGWLRRKLLARRVRKARAVVERYSQAREKMRALRIRPRTRKFLVPGELMGVPPCCIRFTSSAYERLYRELRGQ